MFNKIKIVFGLMAVTALAVWFIGGQIAAGSTTPGTVNDPLVTKSYVDLKVGDLKTELSALFQGNGSVATTSVNTASLDMAEVKSYIDEKLQAIGQGIPIADTSKTSSLFNVVEVNNGQRLIFGASAEVILRAGSATVIAGAQGDGLANLTLGEDLRGGAAVPGQHHLLVSRDDGRGLLVTSDKAYIMVKGAYTLE